MWTTTGRGASVRKSIPARPDYRAAGGFAAKTMDPVWAKQTSIGAAVDTLIKQWQADLDAG